MIPKMINDTVCCQMQLDLLFSQGNNNFKPKISLHDAKLWIKLYLDTIASMDLN